MCSKKLYTILNNLYVIWFNQVKFSVAVEMDEENITSTGADKVEFLFSPNPGQALRPLKNIASGGEISRVMLGLKTVLAPTVPIMVFDESVTGVGGPAEDIGEHRKSGEQNLHVVRTRESALCSQILFSIPAGTIFTFLSYRRTKRRRKMVFIQLYPLKQKTFELRMSAYASCFM